MFDEGWSWRRRLVVYGSAWLFIGLTGLAITVLAVVIVVDATRAEPFDPLGDYPVQKVESRVVGVEGPAVSLEVGRVVIVGTKCNDLMVPVEVEAEQFWIAVDPPGRIVLTIPRVATERTPGCETKTFVNEIPGEVATRGVPAVWRVAGIETPISREGREGVPRTYTSENFVVVP